MHSCVSGNGMVKKRGKSYFLLLFFLLPAVSLFSQTVSLSLKNEPIEKAFKSIESQTAFRFIYSKEAIKQARLITVQLSKVAVTDALSQLFTNQPLRYSVEDNYIMVKAEEEKTSNTALTIKGKVTDENENPLQGVTIFVKRTNSSITTGENGEFLLKDAQPDDVLTFTYIGRETARIPVNGRNYLALHLKMISQALDETVIQAYGTTTRRTGTGNISKIGSKDISEQPVSNPLQAMQGRAPGVLITTQNGLPGGNLKVQVRGQGSVAAGTDPLYVIDGVPFISSPITGSGVANGAAGPISPFSVLNQNDIESIEILKDADATALYGSRAANGVVLITTKKGKSGKTSFTMDVYKGFNAISRLNSFLTTDQYLAIRREAFKNDGLNPTANNAPDLLVWDTTKYTNWQKQILGGKADVNNVQASLSGGNTSTRFLLTANYRKEGTVFPGDWSYKKGGGYLSVDHTYKKLVTSVSFIYSKDDLLLPYAANVTTIASLAPDFPVYNPDGSFDFLGGYNPVASLLQKASSKTDNLIGNAKIKYTLLKNMSLALNGGFTRYTISQVSTLPQVSQNPSINPVALAYFNDNSSNSYVVEPQLEYSYRFKKAKLTTLAGATLQSTEREGSFITGSDVSHPDLLGNLGAAVNITSKSNSYSKYNYASLFGRVNYNLNQKYIVNLNFRRDGSTRFGPGKTFGNFGAAGLAWIFSQEDFMQDNLSFLSFGKLRGSYGITGNDQITDYQYLPSYGSGPMYGSTSTLAPSRLANPDYSWETNKKLEASLDLGFLKDRVLVNASWFRNRSGNQLVPYPLPSQSGFVSYQANLPALIENTGWEFELTTKQFSGKQFTWNSAFNISFIKNKLLKYPGLSSSAFANTYVLGKDLSVVKGYDFRGVNPATGLPVIVDQNKDGLLKFADDAIVLGKTSPDFYGGLDNSIGFKGFEVNVFVQFVKQSAVGFKPSMGTLIQNLPAFVLDRWQKPGDITTVVRATTISSNVTALNSSGAYFGDASYIRVKNLAASYSLPMKWLNKMNINEVKIYAQAQNILTFDNKKRIDPEIPGGTIAISPMKTLVGGIKLTF